MQLMRLKELFLKNKGLLVFGHIGSWLPNNPSSHVAPARFYGNEPTALDKNLRQAQGRFLVSDGVGPMAVDISRGDRVLGLIDEPIQENFEREGSSAQLFDRLRGWRPPLIQPFK